MHKQFTWTLCAKVLFLKNQNWRLSFSKNRNIIRMNANTFLWANIIEQKPTQHTKPPANKLSNIRNGVSFKLGVCAEYVHWLRDSVGIVWFRNELEVEFEFELNWTELKTTQYDILTVKLCFLPFEWKQHFKTDMTRWKKKHAHTPTLTLDRISVQ